MGLMKVLRDANAATDAVNKLADASEKVKPVNGPSSFGMRGGTGSGAATNPRTSRPPRSSSAGADIEKQIADAMSQGGIIKDLIETWVNYLRMGNEVEATKLEPYMRQYGGDAMRKFPFGAAKKWFRPRRSLPSQSGTRAGSQSIDQLMAQGRL